MDKNFQDLLAIARDNMSKNPCVTGLETQAACKERITELLGEVKEVEEEMKENNSVYLTDELSDIAWDYANLLALLEQRGLIDSAEGVLAHSLQKYTERAPAFLVEDQGPWEAIKKTQKEQLQKRHQEIYGD